MSAFENCKPETDASVAVCQPKPVRCGCGGEAKVETDHDTNVQGKPIDWKRVRCSECNIRTTWRSTETEAITAWNRAMGERMVKAEYSNIDGEYLCKACGHVVQIEDEFCCGCGARLEWK